MSFSDKYTISGELPSVAVSVTDERLIQLCRLGVSIPLPEPSSVEPQLSASSKAVFKKDLQREARSIARSNKDLQVVRDLFTASDSPDEGIASEEEEEDGDIFYDATDGERPAKRRRPSNAAKFKTVDVNFTTIQVSSVVLIYSREAENIKGKQTSSKIRVVWKLI